MFPGYDRNREIKREVGAGSGGRRFSPLRNLPKDEDRHALQRSSNREITIDNHLLRKRKDTQVISQCGIGSEDESDDSAPGMRLAEEDHISKELMYRSRGEQEQAKFRREKEQAVAARVDANQYQSFPSAPTRINPYGADARASSSSRRRRDDSIKREISSDESGSDRRPRRRRSRSSSRNRNRSSRHYSDRGSDRGYDRRSSRRSSKKKKHRRRSSSSSSSSSNERSRGRGRDRSRDSRRPSNAPKKPKYNFLTDQEFKEMHGTIPSFLFQHKTSDPENYSLGHNKRETAKCRLGVRYILGAEKKISDQLFKKSYSHECGKDKAYEENRPFHERLVAFAKHVPTEKFFRPVEIKDGYWKISKYKDLRNDDTVDFDGGNHEADANNEELRNLKRAVNDRPQDVKSWLKLIEIEETIFESRPEATTAGARKAFIDRKMALVESAWKHNRSEVVFPLMSTDCMIQMDRSPIEIVERYRSLVHKYSYSPIVWMQYLDYMQYNSNVYNYLRMEECFNDAMNRVAGIVDKTNLAQSGMVSDMGQFAEFQFYLYVRYLKWQLSCGFVPLVIAHIQATFEINFGIPMDIRSLSTRSRLAYLQEFWQTMFPRLGDADARGAENAMMMKGRVTPADLLKMEEVAYNVLTDGIVGAIEGALKQERELAISFVEFERKMIDVDARPKRVDFTQSEVYQRDYEEFVGIRLWNTVQFSEVRAYIKVENSAHVNFVQPLLEILGIVFRNSTGCYSLTEQVIESWRTGSTDQRQRQFEKVPTYCENTFLTVGKRLLMFMIRYEVERQKSCALANGEPFNYVMAFVETEAAEIEKSIDFYKLNFKTYVNFIQTRLQLQDVFEADPILLKVFELTVTEKFISWWERSFELLDEAANAADPTVLTESRKVEMEKIRKRIGAVLQHSLPDKTWSVRNKTMQYIDLQMYLFSLVQNVRVVISFDCPYFERLGCAILGAVPKEYAEIRSNLNVDELINNIREGLKEIVSLMRQKENDFNNELHRPKTILHFPRVLALAETLRIEMEFKLLFLSLDKQSIVKELVDSAIKRCEEYQETKRSMTAGEHELEKMKWDVQMVLNAMIRNLSSTLIDKLYHASFKKIVTKAAELFPCDAKYMRLFAEANSGSCVKSIFLNRTVSRWNAKIIQDRMKKFDIEMERKQLLNSLSTMFASIRLLDGNAKPLSIYNRFVHEAIELRDPAIWRLTVKAAADVSQKCLRQDAYVRSQGQCQWSRNLRLDYLDKCDYSIQEENALNPFAKIICDLLNTIGEPHVSFIEDTDIMESFRDIAISRREDLMREGITSSDL